MRFAVLSDIHGNLAALTAVLADIDAKKIRNIFFSGDIVGYGPDPNACVSMVRERCKLAVTGNHDQALTGQTPFDTFNDLARTAIIWSRGMVSEEHIRYLESLPLTKELRGFDALFVHGTPKDPSAWHYLYSMEDILVNFDHFSGKVCFVGHSHVPFIAEKDKNANVQLFRESAKIRKGGRYIVNSGSVGQPRDGDPRACYIAIDGNRIDVVRVEYDIELTQKKIYEAGLPRKLGERLSRGF